MLFSTLTAVFLAASSVAAHGPNRLSNSDVRMVRRTHRQVARALVAPPAPIDAAPLKKRSSGSKSCSASSASSASNSTTTTDGGDATTDPSGDATTDGTGADTTDGSSDSTSTDTVDSSTSTTTHHHTATTTKKGTPTATSTTNDSAPTNGTSTSTSTSSAKVAKVTDKTCGFNNPSETTTKSSGPNGEESWFNCGLDGSGWTPPMMTLDEMVYISLEDALAMPGTPYSACKNNLDKFNSYGQKYNLPPIMLASFAMQESGCSQSVSNPAGTIGMFQLAPENCKGVDCNDLDTNFDQAGKLIVQYLKDANNSVLGMVGAYNGWYSKMTASKAKQAPCDQQQNLDYLQQWANAWMQGKNGYSVGTIQNCSGNFGKRKRSLYVPRFAKSSDTKELGWHF